jgi:hypothetical protein
MEATAWKEDYCEERVRYRLQVNNIDGRAVKKLKKSMNDWQESGTGWNPTSQSRVLLFSKEFDTEQEWINWAKHFPFKLVELNRKGNPKRTKLGIDAQKKKG